MPAPTDLLAARRRPEADDAEAAVSQARRRYAAEVYRLQEQREWVGLAELAEHLDVSAQAVSRMVRRMKEDGYLVHEPYRGVRLTAAGEAIGLPAIRRHRLVEVFLVKVMGYGWEEIHDLADVLDRGIDDALEARIDALTGHPTRCPHGDPIPTPEGVMPALADRCLVAFPSGSAGTVSRVRTHDADKLRYLREIGLVPGVRFDLVGCGPFNGPLRLTYDRHDVVLGHELAQTIWAETA